MVIFDSNFILFLLQDTLPAPIDPTTGVPVTESKLRISHLIDSLQKNGSKIIIPTPVLAEALVRAEAAAPSYVAKITKASAFRIEPFDTRAAIEVAMMTEAANKLGDKKEGSTETWAKIKYDRQIVAIALANQITTIYSNDKNLKSFAEKRGITVIGVHELDLPPQERQHKFVL